jgi:hypothetical protein
MDTSFWGKDGWKLLHSISYKSHEILEKNPEYLRYYKSFFKSIQYILPCIYCRRSFKKYITEIPFELPLSDWLYKIHNCVNEKLRKQGYKIEKDPSLKASTAPLMFGASIATLSSTPTKTGGGGPSPSKSGSGKKKAKVFRENPEFVLSELERIN